MYHFFLTYTQNIQTKLDSDNLRHLIHSIYFFTFTFAEDAYTPTVYALILQLYYTLPRIKDCLNTTEQSIVHSFSKIQYLHKILAY